MLDKMRMDKIRFIPKVGFNVVGVDDFETIGEQLYRIGHYGTAEEAEAALDKWRARNPGETAHVYGPETK